MQEWDCKIGRGWEGGGRPRLRFWIQQAASNVPSHRVLLCVPNVFAFFCPPTRGTYWFSQFSQQVAYVFTAPRRTVLHTDNRSLHLRYFLWRHDVLAALSLPPRSRNSISTGLSVSRSLNARTRRGEENRVFYRSSIAIFFLISLVDFLRTSFQDSKWSSKRNWW